MWQGWGKAEGRWHCWDKVEGCGGAGARLRAGGAVGIKLRDVAMLRGGRAEMWGKVGAKLVTGVQAEG